MAGTTAVNSTTCRNTINEINEPYKRLATAIILLAVNDYNAAVMKLKAHPNSKEAQRMIVDCGGFFRSDWFTTLADIDGLWLEHRIFDGMDRPKERRRRRRTKTLV